MSASLQLPRREPIVCFWVQERGEVLVSISTDGRVTQWNMKKGLENQDLMVLKRVTAAAKQAPVPVGPYPQPPSGSV